MEVVETCGKGSLSSAEPSTKHSFPSTDEEVVGFVKDAESIMKKLTGGTKELDVISIFGMPGLGKTTLAKKVYDNPSIVNYFDVKAWFSVSQAYKRRTLLIDIFKQATRDKSEIKEDVDIADKLQKTLKGRRYLIVLDDIWDIDAWEDLGLCFPKGEDGSRVMVTTRIEEVAKHLQHNGDPYSLRFLTLKESWELLQRKVFRGESCPPDLLEAGLQVAEHCKGLPLVIVLIAGIIAKMERKAPLWLEVANDLSSLALGEQGMQVIQSSYDHLENHLKPCLLYMALYPEDYKIPVSDLLKLWMAEEFIENIDTENLEETSRIFLNDLLKRSLVMVSGRQRINGAIEYCSLHDLVREFCLKRLAEEKYFMQLAVPHSSNQQSYSKESRLCIYIHDELVKQLDHYEYRLDKIPMFESKQLDYYEYQLDNIPLVKSKETKRFGQFSEFFQFIAHPKSNIWNPADSLHSLVKLRFVQALQLNGRELPSSWVKAVQSLTHLRYLAICVEKFDFKWVSHLRYLQTLVVDYSRYPFRTSTAAFWKMTKLRHVKINSFMFTGDWDAKTGRPILEEPSESTLLKTLCTCRVAVSNAAQKVWWRCPNLEELSLDIISVPSCSLFPIPELHTRLQSLKLDAELSYEEKYSVEWSSYVVFPSNLRELCIRNMFLTEEIVSNIARLQNLESLEVYRGYLVAKDQTLDVRYVEFPALKFLKLFVLFMEEWKALEESFPVLQKLVIKGCYSLEAIPPSFANIPTLQLIEVENCMDSVGDSARNIKREIEENTGCDTLQLLIS
ncbi:PREDICTED: putative late blight resistance protein homolog R1B-16 [Nicotiana attenuata]|uniref:Late blight resistance protein -like r1b-16 n=1 Tax=Nicotiana attenuata TaxID=49451 RepID=A0A1J6IC73_NICAT|nr:PREDICTED: putative late blight resistance protein homolog R1B-16 [Nicotiana attenuata]OIT02170.1 putative late blight resistance protein -like r1b-16 [Nicotiana attenuata]